MFNAGALARRKHQEIKDRLQKYSESHQKGLVIFKWFVDELPKHEHGISVDRGLLIVNIVLPCPEDQIREEVFSHPGWRYKYPAVASAIDNYGLNSEQFYTAIEYHVQELRDMIREENKKEFSRLKKEIGKLQKVERIQNTIAQHL